MSEEKNGGCGTNGHKCTCGGKGKQTPKRRLNDEEIKHGAKHSDGFRITK